MLPGGATGGSHCRIPARGTAPQPPPHRVQPLWAIQRNAWPQSPLRASSVQSQASASGNDGGQELGLVRFRRLHSAFAR